LLDAELEKLTKFYIQEETNLINLYNDLYRQVEELPSEEDYKEHRTLFKDCCRKKEELISKKPFIELYAKIDTLNNYSSLNYNSLKTFLKKYDVKLGTHLKDDFLQRIEALPWTASNMLHSLNNNVKFLYAEIFTNGNLAKALKELRPAAYRFSSFFKGGMFVGGSIPLLIIILYYIFTFPEFFSGPDWETSLYIWRGTGFPVIFLWAWGCLIFAWRRTYVNYVYILQLEVSSVVSYLDIFQMAGILSLGWLVGFLLFLATIGKTWFFTPQLFPYLVLLFDISFLFCPFDIFWRSSRWGLLYSISQILAAPFGRVQFRDFFVADFFTSMVLPLVDMAYGVCFLAYVPFVPEFDRYTAAQCLPLHAKYFSTVIPFLPFWWRFCQCLHKYYQTRLPFPHLVNAGKYMSSMLAVAIGTVRILTHDHHDDENIWDTVFVFVFLSRVINIVYSYMWDIIMDWGLWSREKGLKWPLLRRELLLGSAWMYYFIMIADLFGRLLPLINLFQHRNLLVTELFVFFEICRRIVWGYFRVELEALMNWENYRTMDFVPKLGKDKDNSATAAHMDHEEHEEEKPTAKAKKIERPKESAVKQEQRQTKVLEEIEQRKKKSTQIKNSPSWDTLHVDKDKGVPDEGGVVIEMTSISSTSKGSKTVDGHTPTPKKGKPKSFIHTIGEVFQPLMHKPAPLVKGASESSLRRPLPPEKKRRLRFHPLPTATHHEHFRSEGNFFTEKTPLLAQGHVSHKGAAITPPVSGNAFPIPKIGAMATGYNPLHPPVPSPRGPLSGATSPHLPHRDSMEGRPSGVRGMDLHGFHAPSSLSISPRAHYSANPLVTPAGGSQASSPPGIPLRRFEEHFHYSDGGAGTSPGSGHEFSHPRRASSAFLQRPHVGKWESSGLSSDESESTIRRRRTGQRGYRSLSDDEREDRSLDPIRHQANKGLYDLSSFLPVHSNTRGQFLLSHQHTRIRRSTSERPLGGTNDPSVILPRYPSKTPVERDVKDPNLIPLKEVAHDGYETDNEDSSHEEGGGGHGHHHGHHPHPPDPEHET